MSAVVGAGHSSRYLAQVVLLARESVAQLVRPPSHSRRAEAARKLALHWLLIVAGGALVIVTLMYAADEWEIGLMPPRGTAGLWPVRILTDFGKASYLLWCLAAVLLAVLIVLPLCRRRPRTRLAGFGVRIQFLFLAVLIPMLAGAIVKGFVGRGRPFVGGHANAFNYSHLTWTEAYASFPSGHANASFALAFAVSALWPRMRVAMLIYGLLIASSRLVLLAHHPSDVVAGALLGTIGAMFVRYWFAARHLCFTIDPNGHVVPLAGPSPNRLKGVARDAFAP